MVYDNDSTEKFFVLATDVVDFMMAMGKLFLAIEQQQFDWWQKNNDSSVEYSRFGFADDLSDILDNFGINDKLDLASIFRDCLLLDKSDNRPESAYKLAFEFKHTLSETFKNFLLEHKKEMHKLQRQPIVDSIEKISFGLDDQNKL